MSDPKVEKIRHGWAADPFESIDYLLTKLDEAEKRERVLIAGMRAIADGDGPEFVREFARDILSRLLPSTSTDGVRPHRSMSEAEATVARQAALDTPPLTKEQADEMLEDEPDDVEDAMYYDEMNRGIEADRERDL